MTSVVDLQPVSDPVLKSYRDDLRRVLGSRLKELWLFGSRARGDHDENSDYDLVVVAEGELRDTRSTVADANYRVLDGLGELVGSVVYTPELCAKSRCGPFGMNVLRHGHRLA